MGAPFHLHPFDDAEPADAPLELTAFEIDEPEPVVLTATDLAFGGFLAAVFFGWLAALIAIALHALGHL